MGRPYSQDLRERVMAAVDGGMRVYAAAPVFRVSVSYIYKALGRRTKTGETKARTGRAGPRRSLRRMTTPFAPRSASIPMPRWPSSRPGLQVPARSR